MHLHLSPASIVTILQPTGHLDTYSILLLRMQLERATAVQPAYLVIDLSQVTFLDSRALATLVYHMKRCRAGGGDLYLCGPSQPIQMILELTRLHKAFEIFPNQTSAIAAYAAQLNRGREGTSAVNFRELYGGCDENRSFSSAITQEQNSGFHTEQSIGAAG